MIFYLIKSNISINNKVWLATFKYDRYFRNVYIHLKDIFSKNLFSLNESRERIRNIGEWRMNITIRIVNLF